MTAQLYSIAAERARRQMNDYLGRQMAEINRLRLTAAVKRRECERQEAQFDRETARACVDAGYLSHRDCVERFRAMEDVFAGLPSDRNPTDAA